MAKKKKVFGACTVERTFKQTSGTLNLVTGESKMERSEILTGPCDTPLFGDICQETGICDSCASGWEHPENKFASAQEKERAAKTAKGRPILESRGK